MRIATATLVLAAIACTAGHASADVLPPGFSTVPGVQLWRLDSDHYERFLEADDPFVRHCAQAGAPTLHVASIDTPIACRTEVADAARTDGHRVRLLTTRRLPDPALVSLAPLPARVTPARPSAEELRSLAPVLQTLQATHARETKASFMSTYGGTSRDYDAMLDAIKRTPSHAAHAGMRWRLQTTGGAIMIAAIGVVPDPIGWNLEHVVLRRDGARWVDAGRVQGCALGLRDVDGDGVPEVLVRTCENDEGIGYDMLSLVPAVRRLMSH